MSRRSDPTKPMLHFSVTLSDACKQRVGVRPEKLKEIRHNTQRLVSHLNYGTPSLSDGNNMDTLNSWLKKGELDLDAKVAIYESSLDIMIHPVSWELPFMFAIMIEEESYLNAEIMTQLLNHMPDIHQTKNPNDSKRISLYWKVVRSPYLSCLFNVAKVDFETAVDPDSPYQSTFLNHVLISGYEYQTNLDTAYFAKSNMKTIDLAKTLLDRGCVVHPENMFLLSSKAKPYLNHYANAWLGEWQDFCEGRLSPESLTTSHFNHFFSLGKLPELLSNECWRGKETLALAKFESLPKWAQQSSTQPAPDEQTPSVARELAMLVGRMTPTSACNSVTQWGKTQRPSRPEKMV